MTGFTIERHLVLLVNPVNHKSGLANFRVPTDNRLHLLGMNEHPSDLRRLISRADNRYTIRTGVSSPIHHPVLLRAATALLIALTLAVLAWGIKSLVEAVAIVNSILLNSVLFNTDFRSSHESERLWMIAIAVAAVAVMAIVGYLLFDKGMNAVRARGGEDSAEEETSGG